MKVGRISGGLVVLGVATLAVAGVVALGAPTANAKGKAKTYVMHGYVCTVVATKHHRKVTGTAGAVVCGVSGNDVLRAKGPGRVILIAGPGKDTLIGSSTPGSQDTLIGGTGPDTIDTGTGGGTVVDTGTGNDTINCDNGSSSGTGGDDDGGGTGTGVDESALHADTGTGTGTGTGGSGGVTVIGSDSGDTENSDCSGAANTATLEFHGTINSTDGSSTMNIMVRESNDLAQQFLSSNSSLNPATLDIGLNSSTTIEVDGGGSLTAGQDVEVAANASGTTLTAVDVQAQTGDYTSTGAED